MAFLGSWVSDLARTHTRPLVSIAVREGLTGDDALDAVQEAFHTLLAMPQARSLAAEREDAERLMAVLVRNSARNMRRRHHRARPHSDIESEVVSSGEATVDELIATAEEHLTLLGCVSKLADMQRQVVTLRMLEEVSPETAAQTLGLSARYIAVVLHRAKQRLRDCMA